MPNKPTKRTESLILLEKPGYFAWFSRVIWHRIPPDMSGRVERARD